MDFSIHSDQSSGSQSSSIDPMAGFPNGAAKGRHHQRKPTIPFANTSRHKPRRYGCLMHSQRTGLINFPGGHSLCGSSKEPFMALLSYQCFFTQSSLLWLSLLTSGWMDILDFPQALYAPQLLLFPLIFLHADQNCSTLDSQPVHRCWSNAREQILNGP